MFPISLLPSFSPVAYDSPPSKPRPAVGQQMVDSRMDEGDVLPSENVDIMVKYSYYILLHVSCGS